MLQLFEEALDQIALAVEGAINRALDFAVATCRDVSTPATCFDQFDDGAGIVATVGDEIAIRLEPLSKIGAMVLSDDWPCESTIRTGIPWWSTTALILVLNPPRERPMV